MTKILAIINGWIGTDTIGGGEIHLIKVLQYWIRKENQDISLVTPKIGYRLMSHYLSNLKYVHFSSSEKNIENIRQLISTYMIRMIRSIFADPQPLPILIITLPSHFLYDIIPGFVLRRKLKCKMGVYVHGHFHRTFNKGIIKLIASLNETLSLAIIKSQADLLFVINEEIKSALIKKGFLESKIVLVSNGVDFGIIDSLEGNKTEYKEYDACFCGRLVKLKGVYELLDIWRNVLYIYPKSKLLVLGDGPEYNDMQKLIRKR